MNTSFIFLQKQKVRISFLYFLLVYYLLDSILFICDQSYKIWFICKAVWNTGIFLPHWMHIKTSLIYTCYGPYKRFHSFFIVLAWAWERGDMHFTWHVCQASAEKEQIVFPLELDLTSSDLERKKENLELRLLSPVFCFCSESSSHFFS